MAATPITICTGLRVATRHVTTGVLDLSTAGAGSTDAGATMRLTASATFDAVTGAHVAGVDYTIETSLTSSGPWRSLVDKRVHRDQTTDRFAVVGCDRFVRAVCHFGGNGGAAFTLSGEAV